MVWSVGSELNTTNLNDFSTNSLAVNNIFLSDRTTPWEDFTVAPRAIHSETTVLGVRSGMMVGGGQIVAYRGFTAASATASPTIILGRSGGAGVDQDAETSEVTYPTASTVLGDLRYQGWNGSANKANGYPTAAEIVGLATETFTADSAPGDLSFRLAASGQDDARTEVVKMVSGGNVIVGNSADSTPLASATTRGFLYIPTIDSANMPTGTPVSHGSTVPLVYNVQTDSLHVYNDPADGWSGVSLS